MFKLAAYLGARLPRADGGLVGASVALAAIFLPGFLLVAGVNAAVVGLLGAALYDPVWTGAVRDSIDVAIALVGFVLLASWRVSALLVLAWCVGANIAARVLLGA